MFDTSTYGNLLIINQKTKSRKSNNKFLQKNMSLPEFYRKTVSQTKSTPPARNNNQQKNPQINAQIKSTQDNLKNSNTKELKLSHRLSQDYSGQNPMKTFSKFPKLHGKKYKRHHKTLEQYKKELKIFKTNLYLLQKKIQKNNLIFNKSANMFLSDLQRRYDIKTKFNLNNDCSNHNYNNIDDDKNVNLYIVNINSPLSSFKKDILSVSRNIFNLKINNRINDYINNNKLLYKKNNNKNNGTIKINYSQSLNKAKSIDSPKTRKINLNKSNSKELVQKIFKEKGSKIFNKNKQNNNNEILYRNKSVIISENNSKSMKLVKMNNNTEKKENLKKANNTSKLLKKYSNKNNSSNIIKIKSPLQLFNTKKSKDILFDKVKSINISMTNRNPNIFNSISKSPLNFKNSDLMDLKPTIFPMIHIDNFREHYLPESKFEKLINKKMIYFPLNINLNVSTANDRYYYRINKMYNNQLSEYMSHRINWESYENYNDGCNEYCEGSDYNSEGIQVNFDWRYYSNKIYYKKYKYDNYSNISSLKKLRIVNLFERNFEVGNKKNLFINLIKFCDKKNVNTFGIVPFTIIVNNTKYKEEELSAFKEIFNFVSKVTKNTENNNNVDIITNRKYNEHFWFEKYYKYVSKQYIYINKNYLSNKNYWILKPTDLYQGLGIEISNSYKELYKKCNNIFKGVDKRFQMISNNYYNYNSSEKRENTLNDEEDIIEILSNNSSSIEDDHKIINDTYDTGDNYYKKKRKKFNMYCSNELIIQKYLDNPFLYRKRKFDIRCFVLIDWNLNVFFCKEGHLKASSLLYDVNNINKFIHITNHSLQKKSSKFEQFETGNEISYNNFKKFLIEENIPLEKFDNMIKKMKLLIEISLKSVGEKLFGIQPVLCFEIFGYDFILDNEFNPWILEINNNPGLSISSPLIAKIIPRMIDDAFRLTIDKIFDTKYADECIDSDNNYISKYKLDGYSDKENIFEFLCNIK